MLQGQGCCKMACCASVSLLAPRHAPVCMQVPREEQEVYQKGQHLRGADAEWAEQTRAEMVGTHPPLPQAMLTEQSESHMECV